jgi:hypothetical protein
MRNMLFAKHSKQWYQKDRVLKKTPGVTRKMIEKYVNKAYDALPKYLQKTLEEDKKQNISAIVNLIVMEGRESLVKPYSALKQIGQHRAERTIQARTMFNRFRTETPDVYFKYNSYIYRRGFTSADYFYRNAVFSNSGAIVTARVDLPQNTTGRVSYDYLEITMAFSGDDYFEAKMN